MPQYPRIGLIACAAVLSLSIGAEDSGAQQARPLSARPIHEPLQPTAMPLPQRIAQPPWQFANIRVTVLAPSTAKIDWMPLPNADQYRVLRNGIPLDPPVQASPTATNPLSFTDIGAPTNSTVSYQVTAAQKSSTPGGQPGQNIAYERLIGTSASVSVVMPMNQPTWLPGAWQPVLAARRALPPLHGFVDLHAHPMAYLGFGGKLLYGAPDFVAPGDAPDPRQLPPGCNRGFATNEPEALGHEIDVYGPPGLPPVGSACGNGGRLAVIQAIAPILGAAAYPNQTYAGSLPTGSLPPQSGPPYFVTWPAWNDVLRQKMYVDWMHRAFLGGQRVVVALAVNSKLLGDVVLAGNAGSDLSTNDADTTENQIRELHAFVLRHNWMKIVRNSQELYDAVSRNLLAIVVGVEIDNIGGLVGNVPAAAINSVIDHLYAEDVRYIFPVHLVDNPIGKSAAYDEMFTIANVYEEGGALMHLSCAAQQDNIQWNYNPAVAKVSFLLSHGIQGLSMPVLNCPFGNINAGDKDSRGSPIGLSAAGTQAVQHMMDLGMLIDIDHMSQASASQTLAMATQSRPVAYPLFSGHNNLRGSAGSGSFKERELTSAQYASLGALHGMAGIGGAATDANGWLQTLLATVTAMHAGGIPVAFGTDADGMEVMMPPRAGSAVNPAAPLPTPAVPLQLASDGFKTWDYNHDGVAHYGMLPDFLLDVASLPNGQPVVMQIFNGAQYFFDTWYLAEQDKKL